MAALRVIKFYFMQATRHVRYVFRLLARPALIHLHGVRFPIPMDASERYRRSLYLERHERRLALMIMAKLARNDKVLEMGSGRGVLSTMCAKMIGSNSVQTYEANPALIPFIKQVHSLNGVTPALVNAAIGTETTKVPFYICERTDSSSLLSADLRSEMIEIEQMNVNQAISRFGPTFLVVDIEGAEKEVLEAARLDGVRCIALEIHRKKLGDEGCANLDAAIKTRGFHMNHWLSTSGRKFYERY